MRRLRISGLVGLAKRVRQELTGPISRERLAQLRQEVEEAVAGVEELLGRRHVRAQSLPAPSRKAFRFLKDLDWSSPAAAESSTRNDFPPDSVSFGGLRRHFDNLLDRVARFVDRPEREQVYETIVSDSERVEQEVRTHFIQPIQLKKQAREMRGWLAYFSQRVNFDQYCEAVRRAEPVFREASTWRQARSIAFLVHFRPMHGMYRIRGYPDVVLVHLPTPMISFRQELMRSVAETAFRKRPDRKAVHEAAGSEAYRRIAAAIELLGGVVAQTRGIHHDLADSFDRVNATYFGGSMSRPHLVWSRTFAARKFGHYDHAEDTVMINMVLDRKTVPAFAIDFIMYHELLHKRLGITWKSNRIAAHTTQFTEKEHEFKPYEQAKAVLRKLASER